MFFFVVFLVLRCSLQGAGRIYRKPVLGAAKPDLTFTTIVNRMENLHKRKAVLYGLFLFLFSAHGLKAQTSKDLDLGEAIRLSIDNGKMLKVSAARVQMAEASVTEAKLRQYPDIKISGAYLRMNRPTIDLNLPQSGEGGSDKGTPEIHVDQAVYGMANASLPLFSGGRIRSGIASARYLQKAAELDLAHDKDQLVQTTIAAYYNLYKAQAAVRLVQENLKQAQQRARDFENMEANGLLARNDMLKAQLQAANVELALLDATNESKIANFNMNLMLGLDEDTELKLDTSGMGKQGKILSLEDWEREAIEHRADYQALLQREQAGAQGIRSAQGAYFPSLALTGGYVSAHVPGLLTLTNAANIGVGLSYDISSWYKNGAKVRQARAQYDQSHWSASQMNDEVRKQVHAAYRNYLENLKKIEVYAKAKEQAEENYRITKNKYDNALATTTDLLDADVAQLQAGINYEYAKADAVVAYNKLYETAGLLEKARAAR